jgi:hypothetical protein
MYCYSTFLAKFVQPIPIFWAYLIPLDVDVVPIKFHQFLFGEYHFCVFQFFSISGVTMAMTAILKKINPSQHNITKDKITGSLL